MAESIYSSWVSFHPSYFSIYSKKEIGCPSGFSNLERTERIVNSERRHKGELSVISQRKIKKAIDYMLFLASDKKVYEKSVGRKVKFKLSFTTLTLPAWQSHSDKEIVSKCMNQLLVELRKYHNVKRYVWKAEKQKNDNIHFHLITDSYLPWWELRNRWNRIVGKLGYVDRFYEKHGHRNCNSTDIHSLAKVSNVKAYVVKYVCKGEHEGVSKLECKLWGCSHELLNLKGYEMQIDSQTDTELREVIKQINPFTIKDQYFSVYCASIMQVKYVSNNIFLGFINFLCEHFDYNYQLTT